MDFLFLDYLLQMMDSALVGFPLLKISSSCRNGFQLTSKGFALSFAETLFHGELVLKFETLPQSLFDGFPTP